MKTLAYLTILFISLVSSVKIKTGIKSKSKCKNGCNCDK